MTLPSGVYVIENAQNRNWAILTNDNDGDDVVSGTDADTDDGHKWEVSKLHNGTYLLRNQQFRNHASYKLTDVNHPTVVSIRTGRPNRWRINNIDGYYWISDLEGARCWTLKYDDHETPISLENYTHSAHQHWKIIPENEIHDQVSEAPRPSSKPIPGLKRCPPPTPVFTGRRDILSKMHEYFSSDEGKRHVFVLHGLGGVGKSQITLKFIEECQVDANPSRFSEVFYIDASSAKTVTADLKTVAQVKGVGDSAEDTLQWLSRLKEEWLLFVNNADDTTLNLRDYFPHCSHGNIIITSRNTETRIHAPDPRSDSKISRLTTDDAIELLLKISRVTPEQSGQTMILAGNIVEELGHLALAVVQAGAYISKSGCGLVRYLEMYKERRVGILEECRHQVQKIDDYEWTVYTTWTVSFEKLSQRAASFLNICSFFHHDGIPERLFQKAAANIEFRKLEVSNGLEIAMDFLSSFRSAEGHWDPHEFLTVVSEILSYSLLDFDERNETYSIHPLVHDWTRRRVPDSTTVHGCSQIILSVSIDGGNESKDFTFRRTLLPHIDESLRNGTSMDRYVAACLWRPYYEGGRWKEAEKLQEPVMETMKQSLRDDHPEILTSMAGLASTYWKQGRWKEAEELDVRVMETRKKVLGENHPDTLVSMGNLAQTYNHQGRWKEAEELDVRVMETRKRVLGEDHLDTLKSMGNLARTYCDQGRWKEAEELEVWVMETRQRVLGEEHPDTVLSMGNLATTYSVQGRWKESEELELRVMEARKRILGKEHPDTLLSMGNLATTYSVQGRWKESEELELRVMEARKRVLGEEHPDTLLSMGNLASTYCNQGRLHEAAELEVRVVETRKRVLGVEHPSTLSSMGNLASTYSIQGRSKESEELNMQVMEARKRVLGEEHPDTLLSMSNLALTYNDQGRLDEAEELEVRVMETSKRVLGEEHPDTLTYISRLAETYSSQGRKKEAKELLVHVVEMSKTVLGDDHPRTLAWAAQLASLVDKRGIWNRVKEWVKS